MTEIAKVARKKRKRTEIAKVAPVAPLATVPSLPTLGDDVMLGAIGLVEIKFTEKEEAVLSRAVPLNEVLVKPGGQVYLSHPTYTRWFNEAFGRGGWALVPSAKPMKSVNQVVVPYVLYIHGKPAAFAWGEQEYFETNKQQTYGDALEATVASAMRRCAKRLGVGLELWDKAWGEEFLRSRGAAPKADTTKREQLAGSNPKSGEPISDKQRGRLWGIIKNSGRDENTVRAWLKGKYGIEHTNEVPRKSYDAICEAVEAPGPLPPVVVG